MENLGGDMIEDINKNFTNNREKFTKMIIDEYNHYITEISSRPMAASLPCCLYLMSLYDELRPKRILELGSGFTSYCLRLFKKENNLDTEIYSIDTNAGWLKKSEDYCADRGLDSNNFQTWDVFQKSKKKFNLIFVDIDSGPRRHLYFDPVFTKFSEIGAFVYLDDLHKPPVYRNLDSMLKTVNHKRHNIRKLTQDRKRYSTLVEVQ